MADEPGTPAKPVLGATETVRIVGQRDEVEVEAKVDTGAPRMYVDLDVACDVGAGPLIRTGKFRGSVGSEDRLIVALDVEIRDDHHSIEASIADRSDLSTSVRLGRDVLDGYLVDVER
jgi:hypothetical protein